MISNRVGTEVSTDEKLMYHLLSSFAQPYKKRLQYPKRQKMESKESNDVLDAEAVRLNLSKKDRQMYDRQLNLLSESLPEAKQK